MIWPALLLPELPVIPVIIEPLAIPGDTDVWVIDKSSQITNVKKKLTVHVGRAERGQGLAQIPVGHGG